MALVKFFDPQGDVTDVQVDDGTSVMEGAVRAGIDGIYADCGGQMACATCHVYVGEAWFEKLAPMTDDEEALLEFAAERRETSRLCCQIVVEPDLEGLEILVPAVQAS